MGLREPPAPCSGFCFFLLPSGMLLQLCLQLGRCHLTGPPGPRSWERCLSLFHKKQNPLSEGETGNSAQRVQLSHFRKPSFLLWGKKLHTLSTTVKDQKAPLALDRVLHSWSWSREQQSWQAVLGQSFWAGVNQNGVETRRSLEGF